MPEDLLQEEYVPEEVRTFFAAELLRLGDSVVTVSGLITGVIIVILAFVVAKLSGIGIRRLRAKTGEQAAPSVYIFEKLVGYGVIILGFTVGLSTIGIDLSSFSLFAGALGVGLGFGLQGVVREFISGLLLLFDRLVRIGEYVELQSGERGIIHEISPRAVRIRNNDDVDVLIPNSQFIEQPVINWTSQGKTRRFHVPFSVAYGTDKAAVRDAVLKAAHEVPFTLPDSPKYKTQVWLVGFADSGLNFELVVWPNIDAVKRPNAVHAAYTWAIEDALRAGGFEIPFPQRDIRIRNLFGEEGEDALSTLKLESRRQVRTTEAAASHNDAAEEVLKPIEEPKPEGESAEDGEDPAKS
jgi:small-conductance mechanosensitive channel